MDELNNGILIINKPHGFTSFDVVAKLRGVLKTKKIGHSGTLDPMATGVLPIFIGKSTKLIELMKDHSKSYIATIKLGYNTDTMDITGKVLYEEKTKFCESDILSLLNKYKGDILQVPPMYSAIRVNGQRLYNLARKGEEIYRKPRPVNIFKLEILNFKYEEQTLDIFVECSRGTYIRSLSYDIGRDLGSFACLSSLIRTKSNGFLIENSYTIDEIIRLNNEGVLADKIISPEDVMVDLPKVILCRENTQKFKNGVKLKFDTFKILDGIFKDYLRVYDYQMKFIAIAYKDKDNFLRVKAFFKD